MAKNITLTIYIPEKRILEKQVYRVVLPSGNKTLTVIDDRAPTLLALDMGIVKILSENDEVIEEYFVANGAVDIKENTCTILTEAALAKKGMSLEKAQELYDEFQNPFYEWLVTFFKNDKIVKKTF